MVGEEWVQAAHGAANRFGTPLYLYAFEKVEQRIFELKQATGSAFGIRYAVKTNPNPALLRWLKGRVRSLDVSSQGELLHALRCGWDAADLEFTGPAKTEAELAAALDLGVGSLVLEDDDEVQIVARLAAARRQRVPVLLRISPSMSENRFAVRLAGRPTQFGIDEEALAPAIGRVLRSETLELKGFHVYSGSQCLDGAALAQHFRQLWQLFCRAADEAKGAPLTEFVFGGGLGIPYHDGEAPLSLAELSTACAGISEELGGRFPGAQAFVETGRFLVGEAGLFLTRVIRVKQSRGLRIGVCDGGMNHNLGACGHLGGVSHRHYALRNLSAGAERAAGTVRLVGPLCTAIDTLALRAELPEVQAGDLIAVSCGGAYGPTASPLYFIGHAFPREVLVQSLDGSEHELLDASWLGGVDSSV